jgi:hypothetical protein
VIGQRHRHRRAHRSVAGGLVIGDDDIADLVEGHPKLVANASGLDDHRLGDTERGGDAEQRLEGVALPAARRATVAGLVAHQHVEVAQAGDGRGSDTGTVVGHRDERDLVVFVGAGGDLDDRCPTGALGGVERVVQQLLDDDVPERFGGLPGLRLQRTHLQELCGPRRGEHGALYGGPFGAVPLSPAVLAMLRRHRTEQKAERLRGGNQWTDSGLVFTTELGSPVDPRNLLRVIEAAAKTAGVEGVGIHTLRHSAAVRWLERGVHIKAVADLLGHSSIAITGDVYGHTSDDTARTAVDGLSADLGL